ncbi:MAG TPA: tetratricopeptide repeat protein [Drouetiella sp.]|jgi:tetratricopeptide (TPR) repeat protein
MKYAASIVVKAASAVAFALYCSIGSASAALSVESTSSSSDALVRRGYALVQSGQFKPAAVVLKSAIQLNPTDINARRYLSFALMNVGSFIEAEDQLVSIAKIAPLSAADYYLSGSINVRMGNSDQALKDYKSALMLEPDMPAARAGIIELFVLASDFQGATFLCDDCIKKARDRNEYDYFQKVAGYIRSHKTAAAAFDAASSGFNNANGQQIISPTAVSIPASSPVSKPPAPRDLIPQTIQSPLMAPPKIAPIATRARA